MLATRMSDFWWDFEVPNERLKVSGVWKVVDGSTRACWYPDLTEYVYH